MIRLFIGKILPSILLLLAYTLIAPLASANADNNSLINKGKYLATAGNCAGCHTKANGELYAGGVAFNTNFGTVYSTNITPDTATGIGSWTEDDFKNALWQGLRPDGNHLYPVFPYTSYTGLSEADVSALYHYLKSLNPVSAPPHGNELSFPFDQRWLLTLWKQFFFQPGRFSENSKQSASLNRGAYLVETLGHCSACHTPRNFLGAEIKDLALSGGTYLDYLPNGQIRPWFAVDLTSSKTGLGAWSKEDIAAYLKTGVNNYATSFGPMNKVIKNSTHHLDDNDIEAMASYLHSLPPADHSHKPPITDDTFKQGLSLYSIHCATCHLPTGKGSMETGPSLTGNPVVQAPNPASLLNVILYGPELPELKLPVQRTAMDSYQHQLNDEEVAAIASYIRNAWGNSSSAVTAQQVELQR